MSPAEVERQPEKIMRAPLVVRDRGYPFSENVIVDKTGGVDPDLVVMAKVSSLIEVLRLPAASLPALGAVYFVCPPCERGCHVVTRRDLG